MRIIRKRSLALLTLLISSSLIFSIQNNNLDIKALPKYAIEWKPIEVITTDSTEDSHDATIAVDNLGNAHVAWMDNTVLLASGSDKDIFYKRWDKTSDTWTETELISTGSIDISGDPSIAVDDQGNVYIAWEDESDDFLSSDVDKDIFFRKWDKSTDIWSTTVLVSTENTASSASNNPSLDVDSEGNIHIAWWDSTDFLGTDADEDIFYKRWNVSLGSWTSTEVLSSESTGDSIYPSIVVDTQGDAHLTWSEFSDNYLGSGLDGDVVYRSWRKENESWLAAELVTAGSSADSSYPNLATDNGQLIDIVWYEQTSDLSSGIDMDIFYKQFNTVTKTWITTELVSTESTEDSAYPTVDVDGFGNFHVAWTDWTNYLECGTDTDIFYKSRNATSGSWSTTEIVSTESTGISDSSSISVNNDGLTYIVWRDYTDYQGSGTDTDIFFSGTYVPASDTSKSPFVFLFCVLAMVGLASLVVIKNKR
ncbi:MAG: hypothetical protein GOP50_11450 [Candidatus Heimdallarchaeota archaeon]|nr:hypothetical protein [Candidatus Heimdallarchaeota archaeon]